MSVAEKVESVSKQRIGEIMRTALQVLAENDGQLPSREVIKRTEQKLVLTDYERAKYEKTGYVRWESILHFYSIDCVKAGWLQKHKGVWYLTEEGRKALNLDALTFHPNGAKRIQEVEAEPAG